MMQKVDQRTIAAQSVLFDLIRAHFGIVTMFKAAVALGIMMIAASQCVAMADDAAIMRKLDSAKSTHEREMRRLNKSISDWFSKRGDAARKSGNRKLLDQYQAERNAYHKFARIPRDLPPSLRKKLPSINAALASAYSMACKEYTKSGNDVSAAKVAEELEQFRQRIDGRNYWVGERASYRNVQPGIWHEFQQGQVAFIWKEVDRTSDYIELYDEGRKFWGKFYDDQLLLGGGERNVLKPEMPGKWSE